MEQLAEHLESKIGQLNGSWISKNSSYEDNACIQLDFECQKKRYWDCLYKDTYIEIKKGKSIWLDEVRYCEILLSDTIQNNDDCKQDTITIFIVPTKDKQNIQKILCGPQFKKRFRKINYGMHINIGVEKHTVSA